MLKRCLPFLLAFTATTTCLNSQAVSLEAYRHYQPTESSTLFCSCPVKLGSSDLDTSRCPIPNDRAELVFAIQQRSLDTWFAHLPQDRQAKVAQEMKEDPHLYFLATPVASQTFNRSNGFKIWDSAAQPSPLQCATFVDASTGEMHIEWSAAGSIARANLYAVERYGGKPSFEQMDRLHRISAASPPSAAERRHNLYAAIWKGYENRKIEILTNTIVPPPNALEEKKRRDVNTLLSDLIPESP